MKTKIAIISIVSLILVGCAVPVSITPGAAAIPAATNTVNNVTTIVPAVPAQSAITNYGANPVASQIGTYTAMAAPLIPQPFGSIVGALGILIGVAGGGIAAYKNAKLNDHKTMLGAVIAGVEQGNNTATKSAINTIISATGMQKKLDGIVQDVTASITPTVGKT